MGQRTIFVMSGVALGGIIAAGALLEVTKGLPLRMPAAVTQMAARADDRNPRRAECFGVAPSDGLCTLGTATASETSVDFLFWGDSHADAFMPGMADAATSAEQSGLFAGYSACPPVLNVQRISGGRDCAAFNDEVMSWLESREDMPLVILGARWTLSVEGTRFGGEAGPDVRLEWNGDRTLRPQDTDNAALVSAGLMQTVNGILDTGRQVVLLGPVPEVGRNVPAASARRVLLGWTPEAWVSRADYDARAGATEAMLQQIAAAQDGVRYLPLSDLFCDADICRTTDANGLPLYFDDDHISLTAARNLLPARFQDALGAR